MRPIKSHRICAGTIVVVDKSRSDRRLVGIIRRDSLRFEIGPRGGVNLGEDFADCARRETREELGIDVDVDAEFCLPVNEVYSDTNPTGIAAFTSQTTHYYVARITEEQLGRIRLDGREHVATQVLSFKSAGKLLAKHDRLKDIRLLERVWNYLEGSGPKAETYAANPANAY